MNPEEIKKAREIMDAATPGPWFTDTDENAFGVRCGAGDEYDFICETDICGGRPEKATANAVMISAARTGWPEALDKWQEWEQTAHTLSEEISCLNMKIDNLRAVADATVEFLGFNDGHTIDIGFAIDLVEKLKALEKK